MPTAQYGANTVLLRRLTTQDTALTPLPPSFSGDVAAALGNIGSPDDGWDLDMATPVLALQGDSAASDALGTEAAGLDFPEGQISAGYIDPVGKNIQTFAAAGDGLLADYEGVGAPNDNPAAPPAPGPAPQPEPPPPAPPDPPDPDNYCRDSGDPLCTL